MPGPTGRQERRCPIDQIGDREAADRGQDRSHSGSIRLANLVAADVEDASGDRAVGVAR